MENPIFFLGKTLIVIGIFFILLGFSFFSKIPFLGKLPGDIYIKKENFTFYFPLTSGIVLSIIFSLLFYFFSKIYK